MAGFVKNSLRMTKKILFWILTIFFMVAALGFALNGHVVSAVFGILVIAFIIPIDRWQNLLRKWITGKIKTIITIGMAVVFFATVPVDETEAVEQQKQEASSSEVVGEESQTSEESETETESLIIEEEPAESEMSEETEPLSEESTEPEPEPESEDPEESEEPEEFEESEEPEPEPPSEEPQESPEPEITVVDSTFSIHYIDVGQADAALVECDGHYMLIDGGNKADSDRIYAVLKNADVPKLDIIVGTHAHEDHIGGLPGALNYTTAGVTLCPVKSYDTEAFADFALYAEKNGGGITIPAVGDTYQLGSAKVTILGVNASSEANDSSIVLKIDYRKTSFIFTGDAEREAEQAVLGTGYDLSATVLKVGHHGSDTSTTYPFLREIMPEYAIISVGEDNSYGHPTEDALSRLRDADVTVYRTDLQGDIVVTSDGETVSVSTEKTVSQDAVMEPGYVQPDEPEPEPEPSSDVESEASDYIVNINTGKFHYPYCSSVNRMKESNKMYYTGTRDELIAQGYDPCGNCHP